MTDPIPGFKAVQNPPTVGANCVVFPIQIDGAPNIEIERDAITFTNSVGEVIHPVASSVNIKLANPGEIPVTNPALFIVAIETSLLDHVPVLLALNVVVSPMQIVKSEPGVMIGLPFTTIGGV